MQETWGDYSVEYALDGKQWAIDIRATSIEDAKRRLDRAAAFGAVDGPWKIVPAWRGWWVPLYVRVRAAFGV